MLQSPIYWHPCIYEQIIRLLYKGEYKKRLEIISNEVGNLSVPDVCCGTCTLYQYLQNKNYKVNKIITLKKDVIGIFEVSKNENINK